MGPMTRLPTENLNVLRAIAVLSVVGDHVIQLFTEQIGPLPVRALGRMGVLLFFVHTALVLMSSLERQGRADGWVRAFYVRRAFRIYPLAMFCVLAYVALHVPESVQSLTNPTTFEPLTFRELVLNLALVQNLFVTRMPINVLWSLPIEVQMYLALPFCYVLARRGAGWVVALTGLAAVAWWVGDTYQLRGFWRLTVVNYTPCFLAGVLAYALLYKGAIRRRLPGWAWPPVLLTIAIGLTTALVPGDENPPINWLICVAIGVAIPLVADLPKSWFTRGAKVICDYSYGIYLTHVAALWVAVVVCRSLPGPVQALIFVALASALAFVCYHAIEQPGIALGKRLAVALTGKRQKAGGLLDPAP